MTLLDIIPFWLWLLLYVTILCSCIASVLFQARSAYQEELSLRKRIFHAVVISSIAAASLLLFILAIAFAAENFFRNDPLQGIGFMLLLVFCIGSVFFLIQRHKVNHWRAQNPDACRIEFSRKRVHGKVLKYRILSIDKIPIDQSRSAFIAYRTIYLLPGNHCIEYLLEATDPWWHGRGRGCHEKRRFEMPFIFEPNRLYACEVTGMDGKPGMVSKCKI